jgi:hypothetical protein
MEREQLSQRSNLQRRDFLQFLGISGLGFSASHDVLAKIPETKPIKLPSLPPRRG